MVTDSHNAYPSFARGEHIQLEQFEADKHANGAYNLGRINAVHSKISAYWEKTSERQPATKYMDLSLMLFWWLEKNGQLSTNEKVDELYNLVSGNLGLNGIDYESITNKSLYLNTKRLIPEKV